MRAARVGTRLAKTPDVDEAAAVPGYLTIDNRVPGALRDLLLEADGCSKMGFLLGGTVCAQRAFQTLLTLEGANGATDEARLHELSEKYPTVPKVLFGVCSRLAGAPTDNQAPLDSDRLNLLTVTLKLMLYEIYVIARERAEGLKYVQQILERLEGRNGPARSPAVLAFAER